MIYEYYTDGSARNNGSINAIGAWAYVRIVSNQVTYQDCDLVPGATNQQMELLAMIKACQHAQENCKCNDINDRIILYTDSAYVANCYKQNWYTNWLHNNWTNSRKQPVANKELWEKLIPFFMDPHYEIRKTTGHANDKWNNYADNLAQTASLFGKEAIDVSNSDSCI